jgi:hypothetical protein
VELIHNLGKKSIKKTVDNMSGVSLMLGNNGGYLWIGEKPASRYQGWFFGLENGNIVKIIDNIQADGGKAVALENNFWNVKRVWQNLAESFFLCGNDCLGYELSGVAPVQVFLDIKESYQNPEFGRHYQVERVDDLILISYKQDAEFPSPEIFLAVAGDFKNVEIKNDWVCRGYEFDRRRGSLPWDRWVFSPASMKASRLVFAVADTKEKAVRQAQTYWHNFESTKQKLRQDYGKQRIANDRDLAKYCAQNSLKALFAKKENSLGLRAGLPWFFQFWQRDEAVSLLGLSRFDKKSAMEIFWRQMVELKANDFHFKTADGVGWLFLRAAGFYQSGKFNVGEIPAIREALQNSIDFLLKNNTCHNLAHTGSGEKTWMDSLDRTGAAIEIQALRLNMYSLAADLAANKKQKEYYLQLEKNLKQNVKRLFFDGKNLCDRFDCEKSKLDLAVRPNIFLAAYVYPDLLLKKEWANAFEFALGKLWFDWGGLAMIDKTDGRFCARDTGENPTAYHNGDSWFWVNNIAAIAMARADKNRFKNYIAKIFEASKKDILWHGAIGCASEISSAQTYDPVGCFNQAWSASTFLELCAELKI